MKSTNILFWLRADSTKNIISPVQRGPEYQKGARNTSNKPVFKDKILIVWRGRVISKTTSDINLLSEYEYFHKTKMVPTYMYRMYLYHANYT